MIRFVWQSYVIFCALVHISIMPDAFSDFWILLQYLFGCLQCYINTGCPSLFSYRSVWNLIFISVTNPRQDHLSSPVKKGPCILIINLYQTKSHFVYKKQTKIFSGNKTKRTSESKHFRKAENIFKCCDKADHTVASPPHILRNSSCYHPHLFEGLKAVRFLTLLWSPSGAENKCFRICVSIFTSAVIHACRLWWDGIMFHCPAAHITSGGGEIQSPVLQTESASFNGRDLVPPQPEKNREQSFNMQNGNMQMTLFVLPWALSIETEKLRQPFHLMSCRAGHDCAALSRSSAPETLTRFDSRLPEKWMNTSFVRPLLYL